MYQRTTALAAVGRCRKRRGALSLFVWEGVLLDSVLDRLAQAVGPGGDEV